MPRWSPELYWLNYSFTFIKDRSGVIGQTKNSPGFFLFMKSIYNSLNRLILLNMHICYNRLTYTYQIVFYYVCGYMIKCIFHRNSFVAHNVQNLESIL